MMPIAFTSARALAGLLAAGGLACALTGAALPAYAEVGRLFFTPDERGELEKRRFAPQPAAVRIEAPTASSAPVAPPGPLFATLNGHVLRSSGHSATWLNGTPQYDTFRVDADALRLPLAASKQSVPVKVGQTLEQRSGAKSDLLRGGEIRIHPAPGAGQR